jgi:hypothetical protein
LTVDNVASNVGTLVSTTISDFLAKTPQAAVRILDHFSYHSSRNMHQTFHVQLRRVNCVFES